MVIGRRAILALLALALPASLRAQGSPEWDARRLYATRASLSELLARLDATVQSPAYSSELRQEARAEAGRIRARLTEGDFQAGDRVFLAVEREAQLSDTFTVANGPALVLPAIGSVSLRGALRSELQDTLKSHLSRFIRDPVVRARTVIRVMILGAVGRPGFYSVPSEALFSDALMQAGGPAGSAKLDKIRVVRDEQTILADDRLEKAIVEGRTLDQLNLRAGDRIVVPQRSGGLGRVEGTMRVFTLLLSVPAAIFGLTRLF